MRIGDERGTKFVVLTRRELLGCAGKKPELAERDERTRSEGPTEVRQPSSSARLVKASPNPKRESRGSEGGCGRKNVYAT